MTSVPNSTELELTALQSGRSRSALVKDPEPPSVSPTQKQVDDLFQWHDEIVRHPAVTENLFIPHQIPLPDTSDSDVETLFDHVDSNVFDTYDAPETDSEASHSNSVNIDVTPNNQINHHEQKTPVQIIITYHPAIMDFQIKLDEYGDFLEKQSSVRGVRISSGSWPPRCSIRTVIIDPHGIREDTSSKLPDSNRYEQVNKRSAMAKVQLKEDHINFREVKALNKSKIRSRSQSITSKFEDHDQGIIMVNVIPLDNDHDVPFVEPNQHDDAPVVPEPGLENEDEDLEEDEFEEEEDPQEDEDDMEIDIKEDENEPYVGESSTAAIPREDGDRLLPGFMRRDIDSLFGRMVNFSRRLCRREMAHALVEKKGEAKDRFYSKLILDLGNKVRSSVEQGTAAMEKLVEKLENVGEKAECKKLKKELEEAEMF
ncbi:hypothetical protein Tco_1229185 [Tanacetum coccineum]